MFIVVDVQFVYGDGKCFGLWYYMWQWIGVVGQCFDIEKQCVWYMVGVVFCGYILQGFLFGGCYVGVDNLNFWVINMFCQLVGSDKK